MSAHDMNAESLSVAEPHSHVSQVEPIADTVALTDDPFVWPVDLRREEPLAYWRPPYRAILTFGALGWGIIGLIGCAIWRAVHR